MSEIVNLRQARKRKARAEQAVEAAANRAKHGLSKAERAVQAIESKRIERTLDGAKIDGTEMGGDD